MKTTPGFSELIILALVLAVTGMVLHSGFILSAYGPMALAATASLITAIYLLYLLKRSQSSTGRVTSVCLMFSVFIALWIGNPGMDIFLLVHLLMIIGVRVFFFYPGPLSAILEIGIQSIALFCAVWTFYRTGSVFLSTWVFFLIQALLTTVHDRKKQMTTSNHDSAKAHEQAFNRAKSQAEDALNQLMK